VLIRLAIKTLDMKILYLLIVVIGFVIPLTAQEKDVTGIFGAFKQSKEWVKPEDPAVLKKLEEWQDRKLGLLITFGTYSQWGIVESWSLVTTRHPWNDRPKEYANLDDRAYVKAYENLVTTFNPTGFDPGKWASAAKDGGVKYVMVMSKHHDGFCMWDTKTTDYRITAEKCPYHLSPKADVTRLMSDAFRKQGLSTGIYFSKADWNSPYYWAPDLPPGTGQGPNFKPADRPEEWEKFRAFTWNQVEELMSGYGPQDVLWLDGGSVRPPDAAINMDGMAAMARKHQPGLIVVDRTVSGANENYITPEGEIPDHFLPYPWETCMTMGTSWAYKPDDQFKSTGTLIRNMCRIVARNGNYLIGIGPDGSGRFDPVVYDRLKEMGDWFKVNGEAIYDTRPKSPYESDNSVFTTRRDGTVYVIVLAADDLSAMPEKVMIPVDLAKNTASIKLLGFGELKTGETRNGQTEVLLPQSARTKPPCGHAWALRLTPRKAGTLNAQNMTVGSPMDYQVFQRFSRDKGIIRIAGTVESGVPEFIEIKIDSSGVAGDWIRVPATIRGQSFQASVIMRAGGWYRVELRAVKGKMSLAMAVVEHVGIGEVFLVAGQSNSANYGEEKQQTRTGLVSAFNGTGWQVANDPQPGAEGGSGSFMPLFGDAIAEKFGVPVGIVACGIGATSVREWLPEGSRFPDPPTLTGRVRKLQDGSWESNGKAFNRMVSLMKKMGPDGFRAVLWHQGESDARQPDSSRTLPGYRYWQFMDQLIRASRQEAGWLVPWFTAQVSYHVPGDEATPGIRAAQRALWESGISLEGPDTDLLKGDLRENKGQGVHFSAKGLNAHAAAWIEKVAPWLQGKLDASRFNKILPLSGEVFPVAGREAFVILPSKINGPVPWVWYAPTLPGLPGVEERWMFERFLKAGIAIAGIDVGESYGSPNGTRLYNVFYEELTERRGFSSKPMMLGRSRGGLMTLNWMAENADKTSGFAGIYPVCSLASYPGLDKAYGAYEITAEQLANRLAEYNPIDRMGTLARNKVPFFAIHGDQDALVPLEKNSGELKKRIDKLGGKMELIVPKGQGHNMWTGFFQSPDLVNFVIKNAK
jgi:alpha-L-fucosidase